MSTKYKNNIGYLQTADFSHRYFLIFIKYFKFEKHDLNHSRSRKTGKTYLRYFLCLKFGFNNNFVMCMNLEIVLIVFFLNISKSSLRSEPFSNVINV